MRWEKGDRRSVRHVLETCSHPGRDVWRSENVTEAWVEVDSFRDAIETLALVEVCFLHPNLSVAIVGPLNELLSYHCRSLSCGSALRPLLCLVWKSGAALRDQASEGL